LAEKGQVNCYCCNGKTKKFGHFHNKNRIVQRYRCVRCAKTFSESQPLAGLCVDFGKVCQVVHLLVEGMGIRAISRFTQLDQKTVLKTLETAGQKAAAFLDAKVRNVNANVIQADEIHSFVYSKQYKTHGNNMQRGDQFTFLSIDPQSKLIINWHVGKRTRENADEFLIDLKNRMANRFQLTTDNWKTYSGMDGAVQAVFKNKVDYATETKYFANPVPFVPRRVTGLRRHRCIGKPDMKLATTSHAERMNLSVRLFNRRFTRCTLGFSKKLDNLKHAVALFVWHFNFVRQHRTIGMTPAQAAKLVENPMTIKELIDVAM
jgi:IS1 family transposase/transposase-like protein